MWYNIITREERTLPSKNKKESEKKPMTISSNIELIRRKDGCIAFIENGEETLYTVKDAPYNDLATLYRTLVPMKQADREGYFTSCRADVFEGSVARAAAAKAARPPQVAAKEGISKLMRFFTEFSFVPNFRFINTLANKVAENTSPNPNAVLDFIYNYFALTDSPFAKEIKSKIKSAEFNDILADFALAPPKSHINNRFKVYFGAAGSGKTTKAQSETDNRCVVCNNSMLPADLMEDFIFVEGKPSFKPSILWECMKQGKAIVLDEINLLPFDSLRFLQGILDGKREFTYKGHTVKIADGFCVIGTMNLVVNGAVFNLPEPLVDRAADIVEFNLTAEQLVSAIL